MRDCGSFVRARETFRRFRGNLKCASFYACINGESFAGSEASVMVHVSNIRAKLEDDPLRPAYIKTIRGMGYKIDG